MKVLNLDQILLFYSKIIDQTGGSKGIRDINLVEGALNRAFTTFDEKDLYSSIEHKISVTTYSLIRNHGFVDGNKRIGVATMLLLLRLNNINVAYTQDELVELGMKTAEGTLNEDDILHWIFSHKD